MKMVTSFICLLLLAGCTTTSSTNALVFPDIVVNDGSRTAMVQPTVGGGFVLHNIDSISGASTQESRQEDDSGGWLWAILGGWLGAN